ncbi:LysR substrate-binding domain-containing protein, partial [Klebsiella pneumoniae]|nr:LysR substrate-binding domain-containing protein [Klebsiella pneumoniae]
IMQKQATLGTMGIALLPLEMVSDELRAGTLVQILGEYTVLNGDVAVSLVYPSREFVPRKIREFIDLAVGYFKKREKRQRPAGWIERMGGLHPHCSHSAA